MLFWFIAGVAVGLFLPAPYEAIAKSAFAKVVAWFKA